MPADLKTIVQRMIDAGEPEENIATVIRAYPKSQAPADDRSLFAKAYDAVFTPPEFVTRGAASLANKIDQPTLDRSPWEAAAQGFWAGATEGAASLLTPGDIALTALGARPVSDALKGVRGAARAVEIANQAANIGSMVRGGERVLNADSMQDAAAGAAQIAMGGVGVAAGPRAKTPEVLPPDTSGPQRALPPARIYVDDRGTARVGDLPVIDLTAEPPRAEPPAVVARGKVKPQPTRPPAVTEWEIDPTVDAKEGVRPRVYSGDVNATDAGFVTPEERRALELYREELAEFPAGQGAQIADPNDPNSTIYSPGTPASRAHHAIAKTSRAHEGNQDMVAAIDSLLAGERPTNRIQTAALDLARAYVEKRPGHVPPMFAGLEDIDPAMRRGAAEEAERVADPGWAEFSDAVDDIAYQTRPSELVGAGERGFATTPAMIHAAGGTVGALYGGATGEDFEDRLKRAAVFGAAGAAAPAVLGRLRGAGGIAAREATRLDAGKVAPDEGVSAVGRQPRVPRTRAMGEPIPDPMADTDRFLGKFHPEIRKGIESRLEANDGFQTQRRGVVSVKQQGEIAEEIKVNLSQVLPKGTAASGEVVAAYARAAQETQRKVAEAAAHVSAGNNSDLDLLRLEHARADADVVLKSLMGLRAEAGRSLGTFRYLDTLLQSGDANMVRETADALRKSAQEFALKFKEVKGTPIERYRWLQQQASPTWGDTIRTYMYANMLSGPKTHERNIIGNVSNLAGRTAAHPVSVGVDAARSALTGAPREVFLGELPAGARQMARRFMDESVADAWFSFKEGVNPAALKRSIGKAETGVLDLPRVEFRGGLKNPFNIPGRALDSTDVLFRSMARNMEIGQGAYAQARKEGLSGAAMARRMEQLKQGVGAEGTALLEQAEKNAAKSVFQEEPWDAVKWAAQGYRQKWWGPLQTVMIPFLKTPANILKQGLEASPAGFGMKAARQGGREGTRAQGVAAAGSMAAGVLAYLAGSGRLSGMGPTDPQERATLMETGWRPNSIKIGDKWINYQAIAPIGVQASIVANLVEAFKTGELSEKDYADRVTEAMGRFGNSFLDQSFLSGMSEALEAIKDPERSFSRWASRTGQTMIPFIGAVRSARDVVDPTIRAPKGIVEEAQAAIPGLSASIEPRLSTTGEEVKREGGPVRRALDPFNTASVVDDPAAEEMKRLGLEATRLGTKLAMPGGIEVSREQLFRLRQQQGRFERAQIKRLMANPRYQRASDAQKIKAIETIQRRARQRVNEQARTTIAREARQK